MNTDKTDRYYVVEVCHTGINCDSAQWADFDRWEVTTEAPRNSDGAVQLSGWLGTTQDISRTAHGVYDTEVSACAAIQRILSDAEIGADIDAVADLGGPPWLCAGGWRIDVAPSPDPAVCVVYRPGEHEPLTRDALRLRIMDAIHEGIPPDDVHVEVQRLARELIAEGYNVPVDTIAPLVISLVDS